MAQFSDLPQGATVVSAPQQTGQFSDLPAGATVVSGGDQSKDVTDANGNITSGPDAGGISEGQQVKQAAIGAGKRLLSGIADIGDVATLGLTHLLPGSGQASGGLGATGTALQPTNENQKYGGYVGDLATFELGSGIMDSLQHLPLAERLVQAAKALDIAKKYPVLANLAHKAVQSGLTAGAGTLVSTGSPKAAAVGAVTGGALGAGVEGAGKVAEALSPSSIQKPLQEGINEVAGQTGNTRQAIEKAGNDVLAQSKEAYKTLDEASGGRWQRFDDALKNVRQGIANAAGVDDDKYEALVQKQNEIETSQAQLIEDLKTQGKIDPALADTARENYKKAQALYDVDAAVKASSKGGLTGARTLQIDPAKLSGRLEKLYDSGRLQQAVGEDGANQLLNHSYKAEDTLKTILRTQRFAKYGAKAAAGAAIAGGAGAEVANFVGH